MRKLNTWIKIWYEKVHSASFGGIFITDHVQSVFERQESSSEGRECMSTARNGDFLWFYMENIYHQS